MTQRRAPRPVDARGPRRGLLPGAPRRGARRRRGPSPSSWHSTASAGVLDLGCLGPAGFRGWSGGARRPFVDHRGLGDARLPARRTGAGHLARPASACTGCRRGRVPRCGVTAGRTAAAHRRPPARRSRAAAAAPAAPGPARRARHALARRRPAQPHGALRRRADRRRSWPGSPRRGPGLPRGHRPQHGQPPPRAGRGRRPRTASRCCPARRSPRHGGHANAFGDIGWVDFRRPPTPGPHAARRGGLMSINHPLGGDCAWRHADAATGPRSPRCGTGLARPPLGRPAGLVAAWGPDVDPDRRQRLPPPGTTGGRAPPPPGCSPKTTAPQPCSLPWRPGVRRSPQVPVHPCCCGSGTNFSRSAPKAPRSSAPTDGESSSTRTAPPFPLRAGRTVWKVTRTR